MDLTKTAPRSPYDTLGGIVFVPRAIDKCRAEIAGTLGEYVSRGGRSGMLLEFLGVAEADFFDALRSRTTDEEIWAWLSDQMAPRSDEEIEKFNDMMCSRSPDNGDLDWDWFRERLEESGHAHRTDIKRHFDRLDLDDGREVAEGGRWWRQVEAGPA